MKTHNRQTGLFAENVATEALSKKGYQILERNFANRFGEIDIIAKDKNVLVFVEVKAKRGIILGTPEDMITIQKLKRIQYMATIYMKGRPFPCRIDVVAIILSPHNTVLSFTHYENVYF